jgi:outer membrane immunogenic protein
MGLEASINWPGSNSWGSDFDDWGYSGELNYEAAFKARLGYATGDALLYVNGGLALAKTTRQYWDEVDSEIFFSDKMSSTDYGYTIGGGMEYSFAENLSARAEYSYTDFKQAKDDTASFWEDTYYDTHDLTSHKVMFGLSFHLN